jgi:hypothetical protein
LILAEDKFVRIIAGLQPMHAVIVAAIAMGDGPDYRELIEDGGQSREEFRYAHPRQRCLDRVKRPAFRWTVWLGIKCVVLTGTTAQEYLDDGGVFASILRLGALPQGIDQTHSAGS